MCTNCVQSRKHTGFRFPQSFWWKDFIAICFYTTQPWSLDLCNPIFHHWFHHNIEYCRKYGLYLCDPMCTCELLPKSSPYLGVDSLACKSHRIPIILCPTPYPYILSNYTHLSIYPEVFYRSRKTCNSGFLWISSILCDNVASIIAIRIPCPSQNLCNTSCRVIIPARWILMK